MSSDVDPEAGAETEEGSTTSGRSGGVDDWMKALREMAPYLDLGWRLAGAAAFPPLIGHFLVDMWLGTTPWGLLGGSVLGFAAAILQLKQLNDELSQ